MRKFKKDKEVKIFIQRIADMICDSYYWDELIEHSNEFLSNSGRDFRVTEIGKQYTTDVTFKPVRHGKKT